MQQARRFHPSQADKFQPDKATRSRCGPPPQRSARLPPRAPFSARSGGPVARRCAHQSCACAALGRRNPRTHASFWRVEGASTRHHGARGRLGRRLDVRHQPTQRRRPVPGGLLGRQEGDPLRALAARRRLCTQTHISPLAARCQVYNPDPKDKKGGENYEARVKEMEERVRQISERQKAMIK
eukprot:7381644-Prymnesium_polylepis.1